MKSSVLREYENTFGFDVDELGDSDLDQDEQDASKSFKTSIPSIISTNIDKNDKSDTFTYNES